MRSNDLVWGLCYDLYLLTMLQELMAAELGVGLGWYAHVASSLHVYERHWDLVRRLAESPSTNKALPMRPMEHPEQKGAFLRMERALREGRRASPQGLDPFWKELAEPLRLLSERRHGHALVVHEALA
jgi:thymidylate synthase